MLCPLSPYKSCFLALGSNIGDREANLKRAISSIGEKIGEVVKISSFIETSPMGFDSEYLFLNGVIEVNTPLSPEEILKRTKEIEKEMGRKEKTGSTYEDRPIDIDIILLGKTNIKSPLLTIPHPAFRERDFVLVPLVEIAPNAIDPITGKSVAELWDRFSFLNA
ncbi:MAG: 2-amino-4-hydroxy-6-hydroxymethyldihydropteridine diphosphokinase [Porphyromonas sp.]|nr:2-amino-4-hydroxy-6-hydroxymethyldihydropteridine diphosphokinase [Porphyromonas sp.]